MSELGPILFWTGFAYALYVYAGYPATLALYAYFRSGGSRPPPPLSPDLPHVTLIIAAYNEEQDLRRKLENVRELEYPPDRLQVLVAADGSTDRTVDIAESFASDGVELSYRPGRQGKTAALVHAMERARGDIIVFSDANNMYGSDALLHLVAPFADLEVGIVGGAKTVAAGDGLLGTTEGAYWRYEDAIKRWESSVGSTVAVCGEILALRANLFRTPPPGVINDDFWMALDVLKRGYRVLYAPNARSVERVSATLEDELVRRSRIVAGRLQAIRHVGFGLALRRPRVTWSMVSHKLMRPFVPIAMASMLIGNVLWLFHSAVLPWLIAFLQMLVYGIALVVGERADVARLGRVGALLYAISFLVRSNIAAAAGFLGLVRGRQTALWKRVARRQE